MLSKNLYLGKYKKPAEKCLIFCCIHFFYFYFYITPQISENKNLTGVYSVNLIRMFKAPSELTIQDIDRIKSGVRAIIRNSNGTEYSHDFWTNQRIVIAIVADEPGNASSAKGQSIPNTNLSVINLGPTSTLNFSNSLRVTENSVMIRGELVNEDIKKITNYTELAGLNSSPAVPDFKALSYVIEFPFVFYDENFNGFGDISEKLNLNESNVSKN